MILKNANSNNKADIRSYLCTNEKSLSNSPKKSLKSLESRIDEIRIMRDKETCLPEVADRMTASNLVDRLVGEEAF